MRIIETQQRGRLGTRHLVYLVEITSTHRVSLRYRQLAALRQTLISKHPGAIIPPLPPAHLQLVGVGDEAFIRERRRGLEAWLQAVESSPISRHDLLLSLDQALDGEVDEEEVAEEGEGEAIVGEHARIERALKSLQHEYRCLVEQRLHYAASLEGAIQAMAGLLEAVEGGEGEEDHAFLIKYMGLLGQIAKARQSQTNVSLENPLSVLRGISEADQRRAKGLHDWQRARERLIDAEERIILSQLGQQQPNFERSLRASEELIKAKRREAERGEEAQRMTREFKIDCGHFDRRRVEELASQMQIYRAELEAEQAEVREMLKAINRGHDRLCDYIGKVAIKKCQKVEWKKMEGESLFNCQPLSVSPEPFFTSQEGGRRSVCASFFRSTRVLVFVCLILNPLSPPTTTTTTTVIIITCSHVWFSLNAPGRGAPGSHL